MKKNAPKIMAVFLLLVIAVLMLFAGSGSIRNFFKHDTGDAATDEDTPPIIDNPQIPNDTDKKNPTDNTPIKPLENNFPKLPMTSDYYAYEQTIACDNAIDLKNIHQTPKGIFIIVSNEPCKGDFTLEKKDISIIKMSTEGTLLDIVNLDIKSGAEYLCSQVVTEGIAVVVSDTDSSYCYLVDIDFSSILTVDLPPASSASIYSLDDSFIIFASNILYMVSGGVVTKSSTIHGKILDIIDMNSYFTVFVNGLNEYHILKLDKSLNTLSKSTISSCNMIAVYPVYENKELKFIVAEKSADTIYLAKYLASFRETQDRVCLGIGETASIYINQQTIFAVVSSSSNRIYISDFDLNVVISNNTHLKNLDTIYQCQSYDMGYFMLILNKDGSLSLLDLANEGNVLEETLSITTKQACFAYYRKNVVIVFYKTDNDENTIHIMGINY